MKGYSVTYRHSYDDIGEDKVSLRETMYGSKKLYHSAEVRKILQRISIDSALRAYLECEP